MRKVFRKFVVYLLAVMIVLPSLAVGGLFNAESARAATDTTDPVGDIISPKAFDFISGDFEVKGVADDSDSGVKRVNVKFIEDTSGVKTVFSAVYDSLNKTWTLSMLEGDIADGSYKVVAVIKDNAGNLYKTNEYPVFIDNVDPLVSLDNPSNDEYIGLNYLVTGNATDDNLLLKKLNVRFVALGAPGSYVFNIVDWDPILGDYSIAINDGINTVPDGKYKVVTRAKDLAGNLVKSISRPVYVDSTAPTAPGNVVAQTNSPTVTVSWTASTDTNLVGYNVYRSDDLIIPLNATSLPTSASSYLDKTIVTSASYNYIVEAVDAAGNTTRSVVSNSVAVFTSAPISPVPAVTEAGDKLINVAFNGVGGGVEKYEISVNGIVSKIITVVSDDTGLAYSSDISVANYGDYSVVVKAIGMGGSSESIPWTIRLVAPTVAKEVFVPVKVTPVTTVAPAPVAAVVDTPATSLPATDIEKDTKEDTKEGILDEDGVIKGDENSDNKEEINWTPWIILFILIILAGAATGGYFYWFGDEEEVQTSVRDSSKKASNKPKSKTATKKKPRRW